MISMLLDDAATLLGCTPQGTGLRFTGVTTDSREIEAGMLFAALSGERSDGHDFASGALAAGAAALLVSRLVETGGSPPPPQLVVDDALKALGSLAGAWRAETDPEVIAITGSNGKTTTKEMLASILSIEAPVLATSGNFNNELGLPLTMFGLDGEHRYCVLEMGASKRGDISYLAGIARPRVGLVTNVGPAHLRGFGSEEGVARAKGELYGALPADGIAVINSDEPWVSLWRELSTAGEILTFGRGQEADVSFIGSGREVRIRTPNGDFPLHLALPGDHNLLNALAATAAAQALGIPTGQIREGLEATRPVPGRLNLVRAEAGWTVIDDSYNANPASLYAALQVLAAENGERWLVLGDMKELGQGSRKMHGEMGEAARALGVDRIFAVGDASVFTVDAFGSGGRHFNDQGSLLEVLCAELRPGVCCLVKGSRSMKMEQVVQVITGSTAMREAG